MTELDANDVKTRQMLALEAIAQSLAQIVSEARQTKAELQRMNVQLTSIAHRRS